MQHQMTVQTKYYNLLKDGIKTVELRLFDEKRQKIKIGDKITFSDASNSNDNFEAEVIELHRANTFNDLFEKIDLKTTGESDPLVMIGTLEKFYPNSKQLEHSVVGIEIEKL